MLIAAALGSTTGDYPTHDDKITPGAGCRGIAAPGYESGQAHSRVLLAWRMGPAHGDRGMLRERDSDATQAFGSARALQLLLPSPRRCDGDCTRRYCPPCRAGTVSIRVAVRSLRAQVASFRDSIARCSWGKGLGRSDICCRAGSA